ncbi:MAG: diaminopimelate epimerase, partial [Deltaproteobacteria bacterium]|nr:diaminopimelate epimerase [Deltaproteobacteria bacterium]
MHFTKMHGLGNDFIVIDCRKKKIAGLSRLIRCFAKYIWDRKLSKKDVLEIETLAGVIKPKRAGKMVTVDMGTPILEAKDIPVNLSGRIIKHPLHVAKKEFEITCISMGNPHCVIFVDKVSGFPVTQYGPLIENHPLFPKRINVEFVEVVSKKELNMRVWERGSGETLACGTGACAAAVAANLNGLAGRKVTIHLAGGDLKIDWSEKDNHVYMTGPAADV